MTTLNIAGELPDDETFRLHIGELTAAELRIAKAAYRFAIAALARQEPVTERAAVDLAPLHSVIESMRSFSESEIEPGWGEFDSWLDQLQKIDSQQEQRAVPDDVRRDAEPLPAIVKEVLAWYASDPRVWVAWNADGWAEEEAAKKSGHYTYIGEDRSGHNEYVPNEVRAEEALGALIEWENAAMAAQLQGEQLPTGLPPITAPEVP